ncbi:MAG: ATP-dependent Clp protease proteolytic subunit [Candidatus Parcubacteria bacterium]|nr:ATP-dependent Clp protease proteolytic subunit [Candidatus Parcubacteria bacterium]
MSDKRQHLFREGESVVLVPGFDIRAYIEDDEDEGGGAFRLGRGEENMIRTDLLESDTPKILIHEPITFRTADYIRKAVTFVSVVHAKKLPMIEVEITTPGGSVEASFEIYNRFKGYAGGVVGVVQGYGYSGGGFILQGCHHRIVNEYSKIMVHKASTIIHVTEHLLSNPAKLERVRRDMAEDNERLLRMCVERVRLSQPERDIKDIERRISKLFVQERFLYAEQAKEEGLCDIVDTIHLTRIEQEEEKPTKAKRKQITRPTV